jgi:hypothetical protein
MAVQPPTSLRTSHSFGGILVDISDLAGVARISRGKVALCPEDRGEGSVEVAVKQRCFGFNERSKVLDEMRGNAVKRQAVKHNSRVEFAEKSIFDRMGVRVGRNYVTEKIL